MKMTVTPAGRLNGEIRVPGDKSISHRAVMLGSIALGDTYITNFLMSEDCMSTIRAFRLMGVPISTDDPGTVVVKGGGLRGLKAPLTAIDAGNSGTTARLLAGILSGQSFSSTVTGDDSLRRRPMDRVIIPLRQMGARISGAQDRYLPLSIEGGALKGIEYTMPVASAQVKSCIILATLYANSPSRIYQPAPSRNHTELMLQAFGGRLDIQGNEITAYPASQLYGQRVDIPGDISSAAFFITAGLLVPNSSIILRGVGLNPTRTGILEVYRKMGGNTAIENVTESGGEKKGDIIVASSQLKGTVIGGQLIPRLIDEIPVIALAATQAEGTTVIKDAQELKVKESNRIATVVDILSRLGARIEPTDDGMVIHGPTPLKGNAVDSFGDHRLAMMAAIAGLIARGETTINGWECVNISFPGFYNALKRLQD